MRVDIDKYYIYLFVGLIPWIFFASSIQVGAVSIMINKDLIKEDILSKNNITNSIY